MAASRLAATAALRAARKKVQGISAMRYFLVGDSADHGQMWVDSAVSGDGRVINMIALQERLGVDSAKSVRRRDGELADRLYSAGKDLLVSVRAKELLETARLPEDLKFISTEVADRSGTRLGEYFIVISATQFGVVDYDRSELRHFVSGGEVVRSIRTYCLRRGRLPDCDLFLTEQDDWNWIASERVADLFTQNGVTGFRFIPVQLVD